MKLPVHIAILFVVLAGCERSSPPGTDFDRSTTQAQPEAPGSPGRGRQPIEAASPGIELKAPAARQRQARHETTVADHVFRPADDRVQHDEDALKAAGINRLSSTRLLLYTDLPLETVRDLPELVDALFPEWERYFGPLPPARDDSSYQLTGYVMSDPNLFAELGLVPEDLPYFEHGLHRGRRFWIRDQAYDYYRAHLLLHEATHCYMTALPGSIGPVWYMEGMAEYFSAHRREDDAEVLFKTMPKAPAETAGFDRISVIRSENQTGRYHSLEDVFAISPIAFIEKPPYAWSWAACYFLDNHPRYSERFRQLANPRIRSSFGAAFKKAFQDDWDALTTDWELFARTLCYGYQIQEAMTHYSDGRDSPVSGASKTVVLSNRGWQSTGWSVEAGRAYIVEAEGEVVLAEDPEPWRSEASGIGFDYADGRPLGLLLAAVLPSDSSKGMPSASGLNAAISIGKHAIITAPVSGTLFFRVNDGWDRLSDNKGKFSVTVRIAGD